MLAGQVKTALKENPYCWILKRIYFKPVLVALIIIVSLGKLPRDKSFFYFLLHTHKLAFLEASLWEPTIKRVISMFIHARGVLLTCEQEKWTSSQGLWVFGVFLSTGAFWIQLFSQEAKVYRGHALVLCCDMSINTSLFSPSYLAALFPFPVSSNMSHSLILLFLLINGKWFLKMCIWEHQQRRWRGQTVSLARFSLFSASCATFWANPESKLINYLWIFSSPETSMELGIITFQYMPNFPNSKYIMAQWRHEYSLAQTASLCPLHLGFIISTQEVEKKECVSGQRNSASPLHLVCVSVPSLWAMCCNGCLQS